MTDYYRGYRDALAKRPPPPPMPRSSYEHMTNIFGRHTRDCEEHDRAEDERWREENHAYRKLLFQMGKGPDPEQPVEGGVMSMPADIVESPDATVLFQRRVRIADARAVRLEAMRRGLSVEELFDEFIASLVPEGVPRGE